MKQALRFSFSLLLSIAASGVVFSQNTDSVKVKSSGIELSLDYGKLITLASEFESKWSAGIGYRYKNKVMLTVSGGMSSLDPKNAYQNGSFHAEGKHGSISLNYIVTVKAQNYLYFGAGYGVSMYEDKYSYSIGNSIWPVASESQTRTDLQADWAFVNIGTEKLLKIKGLYLGGVFSIRKLLSYDEFEPVDTYAIPGYGRTTDSTVPALNLYIKYLL